MKDYIEKCLRKTITIKDNTELYHRLPLKYKGIYDLYTVLQDGIEWIIAQPKGDVRLNALRRDRKQIEKTAGLNCAFYFTKLNHYSQEIMLNEGIPFILDKKQMFLPFLGMLLFENNGRQLKPVHVISFLTQKLILCAIYEKWAEMNATKIAERLNVTKMSVSRCLDEIEYLDIDILDTSGKSRKITIADEAQSVWEKVKPVLRNPVITKFQLTQDIGLKKKAGLSALCEYSLLADNPYPTYAVTKKELSDVSIRNYRQVSIGEEIGCEILELGYFIDFRAKQVQDPLSVLMSLSEDEMDDERVQICVNEMLEGYVW